MVSSSLSRAIACLERLPALPVTAAKAVALLSKGNPAASEVERLFRADEGLAAATLRRANSAAHAAGSTRSFGLREAIARLGNKALLRIALEHSAAGPLQDGGKCFGLERGALWRSSLGGAAVAERLAYESGLADPDLCFSAALLRDIGKLALDALAGSERALSWQHEDDHRAFSQVEEERFGIDHAALGAMLAERWKLPGDVVNAIRHHHLPPDQPVDPVCDVVHCADCVARWAGLGIGDDGLFHPLAPRARDAVGLTRERVESLAAHAIDTVASLTKDLHGGQKDTSADDQPARKIA